MILYILSKNKKKRFYDFECGIELFKYMKFCHEKLGEVKKLKSVFNENLNLR